MCVSQTKSNRHLESVTNLEVIIIKLWVTAGQLQQLDLNQPFLLTPCHQPSVSIINIPLLIGISQYVVNLLLQVTGLVLRFRSIPLTIPLKSLIIIIVIIVASWVLLPVSAVVKRVSQVRLRGGESRLELMWI